MRPGDRITLLRKLADRLVEDDYPWEDRDLVLRQFGFTTDGSFDEEGMRTYVLRHLQNGSDDSLVELDEYLFGGSSRDTLELADLAWETGTFRLFISHTSAHAALAGELRTIFSAWRIDAFVEHTTIEPTREWQREIEAALATCHAFTALLTSDFVESKWCDQEVGFCLARRVPIVPVRLDSCLERHVPGAVGIHMAEPGLRTGGWVVADIGAHKTILGGRHFALPPFSLGKPAQGALAGH